MSLACLEAELLPNLEFHFLKFLLNCYSASTQFLSFRSIRGFWRWSQMIPHTPKHCFCHQNNVSSMLRTWVTPKVRISLLEAKILPPWRVPWLATVPTSPPWPTYQSVASENGLKLFLVLKNMAFDTKIKCLAYSEAKLRNSPFIPQGGIFLENRKIGIGHGPILVHILRPVQGLFCALYIREQWKKTLHRV